MRTSTSPDLLHSAQKAQEAEYSPRTNRPQPFLHHLAPALPVAHTVFLWPQAVSEVSSLTHQMQYQSIWSDARALLQSPGKYFQANCTHCTPWSVARGFYARKVRLLDYLIQLWEQKLPKLYSPSNTDFWERTLEQTNSRPCQLTNCWCSPKEEIQATSWLSTPLQTLECLPLLSELLASGNQDPT